MADHVAIAGLVCDVTGAVLLARALAFERPAAYAGAWARGPTYATVAGYDPTRDLDRARDAVEARVGATLLLLGFVGQLVGAVRSSWSSTAGAITYAVAVLVVVCAIAALGPLQRRRERVTFVAMLLATDDQDRRIKLYDAYLAHFTRTGRNSNDLDAWLDEATQRLGRQPWADLRREPETT